MFSLNKKSSQLNDESILGAVFKKFYYSSVFAILCGCIGQILGNIIIGHTLGEGKLAVMSLVLPVYYIFATIGNLTGIGGSAVCAMLIGKRKHDECKKAFTVTYILTLVLCVVFSVIVILLLPNIVDLLGTPKDLYDDVKIYCTIMSIGGIFVAGVYLSFNFLRLDGKTVATTLTFVIMAVINVVLDIVLAYKGVAGIAIATVAGSAGATVFGIFIFAFGSKTFRFCLLSVKEFFSFSGRIFKVGSPGATENISILLKSYLLNRIITLILGTAALSSLSVINSINSFALSIIAGSAGALVPIVGVFASERDNVSIRRTLRSAIKSSGLMLGVFMAVIVVFASSVANLFGVVDGVEGTVYAIRIFALSLPLSLLTNFIIYLHIANNHTIISNILSALKNCVLLVVSAFVFMKLFAETGLWLSFIACEVLTLLTAFALHLFTKSKKKNLSLFLLLDTKFEKSGSTIAITTKDDDASLSVAASKLEEFCSQNDLSSKRSMIITLSMDEMLHMAAEHSTRPANNHTISIRVIITNDIIVMRLRYIGELFNPIDYYEEKKTDSNDIEAMLELADCLGMKMVTDACDVVDYRTTFGINNLTVILNTN